ncbi:uncharacterized protein LOC143033701 [Oratosquilla oratoria]|uniref:uncharacterized protein LOC143033701 n=1 Tax=Oratosquilla oratoria TaxID=337810 RepID=UPI003F7606C9
MTATALKPGGMLFLLLLLLFLALFAAPNIALLPHNSTCLENPAATNGNDSKILTLTWCRLSNRQCLEFCRGQETHPHYRYNHPTCYCYNNTPHNYTNDSSNKSLAKSCGELYHKHLVFFSSSYRLRVTDNETGFFRCETEEPHVCNGSLMHGSHGLLDYMQTYRLNHGETDRNDQNDSVKMANSLSPYTDGNNNEFFKINGDKLTIAFRKKVVVSGLYIKGGQSNFIKKFQLAFQYDDDYISNVTNTNEYNYSPWYYSEDTELHQTRFKSWGTNAKYLYVRPHAADRVILHVKDYTGEPRIKLDILGCVYDINTEKGMETQTLDTCFLYRPETLLANAFEMDSFWSPPMQNPTGGGEIYSYFHMYNYDHKERGQ